MSNPIAIRINLDRILMILFYVYAFSLPFELVLEYLFNIDTILKPFRVISLLIIGVFFIRLFKNKLYLNQDDRSDFFLYFVFIYGLVISIVRIIGGVFHFGLFYNDLFQTSLYLITFFIFKTMPFSKAELLKLFRYFSIGICINAAYIFIDFIFFSHHGRQSGFTDNPNYGSLGLVAVMIYLLLRVTYVPKFWYRMGYTLLTLLLAYVFIIEGSRTGLVMFLVALGFLFLFYSLRRKIMLLMISLGLVLLLLIPQDLNKVSLGGGPLILISRVAYNMNTGEEDVRFVVWRGVFRILEDTGYIGMGIGQFKAQFPRHFGEESHKLILEMVNHGYFLSTHNDYLAILTDYGLPSLLFYLAFLFFAMKKITRRVLEPAEDAEAQLLTRFNFILLASLIIFGMAAENFQHQLFWFLLAFATKKYTIAEEPLPELKTEII